MRIKRIFSLLAILMVATYGYGQTDSLAVEADSIEGAQFFAPEYDILQEITTDPQSDWYYPLLLKRFQRADTSLALEDIHVIYYGWTLQSRYNPYHHSEEVEKALKYLEEEQPTKKQLKKALKCLDKAIEENPVDLRTYNYRHYVNVQLHGKDSRQADEDAFHFVALASVIHASGDAQSYETAMHVISPSHEYDIMNYNGLTPAGQSLHQYGGHKYDVMKVAENEMGIEELYFNVDASFRHMAKLFGEEEEGSGADGVLASLSMGSDESNHGLATTIALGRKVVIKLDDTLTDGHYGFTVISSEKIDTSMSFLENEQYFPEEGEEGTIIFYFVNSSWSDKRDCIVLMMKSFAKESLEYDTEIRGIGSREYVSTSNDGLFAGVRGTEIWNDPLSAIRISNIRPITINEE